MNGARVEIVTAAPRLPRMDLLSGIRDKVAAKAWGDKHGYSAVFFWPSRQRVYAERMAQVVEQAAALEAQSAELVQFAEGES